jgi:inorganic pyrophosphatase
MPPAKRTSFDELASKQPSCRVLSPGLRSQRPREWFDGTRDTQEWRNYPATNPNVPPPCKSRRDGLATFLRHPDCNFRSEVRSQSPIAALAPRMRGRSLQVVIETPKGTRNKFDFDAKAQVFSLGAVLPVGSSFPFDFGFVPRTVADDGDPLDILLLMDEPAFPGCVIEARLIGVIEATQTQKGKKIRNDRLIGVAAESHLHRSLTSIDEVDSRLLDEIEEFFRSYNEMKGAKFKPIGRHGPARAKTLVKKGLRKAKAKNKR